MVAVQSETEKKIDELERSLNHLQSLYEQYFAGVLKTLPLKERSKFDEKLRSTASMQQKSTAASFRLRNLRSRYGQLSRLWEKNTRQIEEGHFRREQFRAKQSYSKTDKTKSPPPNTDQTNLEELYRQLSTQSKAPPKEAFINKMQKKIQEFQTKNPNLKPKFKLCKDSKGNTQVRITASRS